MTRDTRWIVSGVVVAMLLVGSGCAVAGEQTGGAADPVSSEQFEQWMSELSNWGRWGDDDQLGAINLITPAKRQQAAALVRTGRTVSLAHDWITDRAVDAAEPFELDVTHLEGGLGIAMERQSISYHGSTFSHIDALCHVSHNGQVYNGRDFEETVSTENGCVSLGIGNLQEGIVTRGVLLDIPRLRGVPYLEPGDGVTRADIEAWEEQAGVTISAGDVVLLRSGRWTRREEVGPFNPPTGYDPSVIPLLKERDIAILGGDGFQEGGNEVPGIILPVHKFALVALGVHLLDNLDLEALAETAAELNRWEFLLMVGPLRVQGGAGSPVNPIAVF